MNRNAYIDKCLAEMAQMRARAQAVAIANLQRARKDAEFLELDKAEKEATFTLGKLRATNKKSVDLEEQLKKVREKKQARLEVLGLSLSDLEPKYECKKCRDLGYANGGMCDCLKKRVNAMILKDCGAGKDQLSDFKDFNADIAKTEEHKLQLLKLKKKFEMIAADYPKAAPRFIVLSGRPGTGKTFIAECLARALIERGFVVSFVTAFGMNNLFLNYHTAANDQKQVYLNTLLDPDVLVIDDLGTEPIINKVTGEYLLLLLSERSRLGRLTIVTTNLGVEQLQDRYRERIFSRLFNKRESLLFQIEGKNLRISK